MLSDHINSACLPVHDVHTGIWDQMLVIISSSWWHPAASLIPLQKLSPNLTSHRNRIMLQILSLLEVFFHFHSVFHIKSDRCGNVIISFVYMQYLYTLNHNVDACLCIPPIDGVVQSFSSQFVA